MTNIRTQREINRSQTIREQLLAALALFFAAVALLLAGVGLYGVLDYSVLQRQREIGIRIAVGAPAIRVARIVVSGIFAMVACGVVFGAGLSLAAAGYVDTLLYEVKPTDAVMLLRTLLAMMVIAVVASIAPVARAVNIEPMTVLKAE